VRGAKRPNLRNLRGISCNIQKREHKTRIQRHTVADLMLGTARVDGLAGRHGQNKDGNSAIECDLAASFSCCSANVSTVAVPAQSCSHPRLSRSGST